MNCESILELVTTFEDLETATRVSQVAIEQSIAACAQIEGPILSIYRWEGKVEQSQEFRVTFKISPDKKEEAVRWLLSQHPYKLPQVVLRDSGATQAYSKWVSQQTT